MRFVEIKEAIMKNQICFALAAATAVLGMPSPGQAQELPTVRVNVADLNLLAPSDKAVLVRRIKAAVDKVCSTGDFAPDLYSFVARARCRATAHVGADRQVATLIDRRRAMAEMQAQSGHKDGTAVASR